MKKLFLTFIFILYLSPIYANPFSMSPNFYEIGTEIFNIYSKEFVNKSLDNECDANAYANDYFHNCNAGRYRSFDGSEYIGHWQHNERHGFGALRHFDESIYVGYFKQGLKWGDGTYYGADGSKYSGQWNNDMKNGKGTFTDYRGDTYEGNWENGFKSGYGVLAQSNGLKYTGEWKIGMRHGQGTQKWPDGYIEKGFWHRDTFAKHKKSIEENEKKYHKDESIRVTENIKLYPVASGSAFALTRSGFLISNNHVVSGCQQVTVHNDDNKNEMISKIILNDYQNDVVLMQAKILVKNGIPINKNNVSLMENIYVAGFPFGNYYSSSVKVTRGIVSSLSGVGNNFSNFQIDAALQPGNSGGPVINEKGNLVGVAVAKLDESKVFEEHGTLPENTNFAIKSSIVKSITESANIFLEKPNKNNISRKELAMLISNTTFHVTCYMTKEQIKKIQSQSGKVLFKNIEFN